MPAIRIHGGSVSALAQGEARLLAVDPPITLVHGESGFFAIDDTCTHGKASLAEGYIEGDTIECPLHMAQFCVRTGNPLCAPATIALRTYDVMIEGDELFVLLQQDNA